MSAPQSWLWPDHVIGKRESRRLRAQHNALVNAHAEALDALREMITEARERNRAAGETVFNPAALETGLAVVAASERPA